MCATRVLSVAGCWLLLFVLNAGPVAAVTRHVPTEFSTIQAAVSASGQGDTVLVLPGTYRENIVITRDVWLRSAGGPAITVIDGSSPSHPDSASVVAIVSPESSAITGGGIEGFDIRNGSGTRRWTQFYGGGIFVQWTGAPGPLIRNNWIHDNHVEREGAVSGGGLSAGDYYGGAVRVISNRIYSNTVRDTRNHTSTAAAVLMPYTSPSQLEGNEIFDNHILTESGPSNFGAVSAGEAVVRRNIIACNEGGSHCSALSAEGVVEGNTIVANWSRTDSPATTPATWIDGGLDYLATVRGNNISYNVGPGLECVQRVVPPFHSFIVECNNIAVNFPGGQIIGACSDAIGQDGNISVDPEFGRGTGCPSSPGDWCLGPDSPLLPANSPPGCGLVGALGVCGPIAVPEVELPRPSVFWALDPRPNPFSVRTRIPFHLGEAATVEVAIYGVMGRKVRTLQPGFLGAGDHELVWDGRDAGGKRAAAGGYVAVIRAGSAEVTRTLLLVW